MSYASFRRLPYLKSYEYLHEHLRNTAPLKKVKGSLDYTIYPLRERNKGRQFSMRMVGDAASKPVGRWYEQAPTAKEGDIEVILYSSPVITFHKPDEDGAEYITLFMGAYPRWSMSDAVFIQETLGTFVKGASTNRGRMVIDLYQGEKVVIPRKGYVRLRIQRTTPNDLLVPVQEGATQLMTLRIKRKEANEVRARYGEFYRYVKGMVNVRKELHERGYYDYRNSEEVIETQYLVKLTGEEMTSVVPTEDSGSGEMRFAQQYTRNPAHIKPPKQMKKYRFNDFNNTHEEYFTTEDYEQWKANVEEFLTFVRNGADHESMYKGFVWLAFYARLRAMRYMHKVDNMMAVEDEDFAKTLDEIVFKYHSDEVFERVPAKPNTVPSNKYEAWITRETNDNA